MDVAFYEDSYGARITRTELVVGNAGANETPTAIPMEKIKFASVSSSPGLKQVKAGVMLAVLGGLTILFAQGTNKLLGVVPFVGGAFMLFHPSWRKHYLFLGAEQGADIPVFPLRAYDGKSGRECVERMALAIEAAKRGAGSQGR
jgi:hypothetical protein